MNHTVFEPALLAGIELKNRIIRSATHEGMADAEGFPTSKLRKLYIRLAKGDVGAIITGYAGIQADGKSPLFAMTMMDSDDRIPAYREIVDAVHEYGTPIIMQIAHCGRQTRSKITGLQTVAPSAVRDAFYSEDMPKELSEENINEIIDNFVLAVVRVKRAGFDGVQLHLAHGYLLSEFLSSDSNRRKDHWGGSTENKYRMIGEIFKRAKEQVGDYPILVKMNAHDGRKNGMKIDEALRIAKMLEKSGCAAIEVSCGVVEDGLYTTRGEKLPADAAMAYNFKYKNIPGPIKAIAKPVLRTFMKQPKPLLKFNLDSAIQIKKAVNIPVIVVGGINNLRDIKDIIENQAVDFVSMARPFIIEPNIVKKFHEGTQTKSKCIMCNYCAIIGEEEPLRCYCGKLPKRKTA
ncbi:NADH oxidase [bacterium BMS3Abin05]|nr:NADH oxidase [bacterium BMS3Abin05]GBE27161.1 NADH oxidase [bacterium BMS3Bbin03]